MKRPIVAIDGPAGAGKTTVTRKVAEQLGYVLVDTGALYRAVALAAIRRGLSPSDADQVSALAQNLSEAGQLQLRSGTGGVSEVWLDGEDVSGEIRTPEISQGASKVSAIPEVRSALLEMQRRAGASGGAVLEGRDIGSVVFPQAQAKFYLTASVEKRAIRRHQELLSKGGSQTLSEVVDDVKERDRRDSSRAIAPLVRAPDAECVDSSDMTVDEVVEHIVGRVREIENKLNPA